MKLAFSSNAFRNFSLGYAIEQVARLGYDGIEIMCDVPHAYPPSLSPEAVSEIAASIGRSGLRISNLNAFMLCALGDFHHPSWIEPGKADRKHRMLHTIECVKLAGQLGVGTVSTEPGGPVSDMDRGEAMDLFVRGVRQVIPFAEERGIKILVEPEPGLLLQTGSDFLEFASRIKSNNVGLNFDVGHFWCVGEDVPQLIREMRRYIGHFHIEDIRNRVHRHLIPGEGSVDFRSILMAMDDIGYDGFVTVELYPYLDNPVQAAAAAMKHLKSVAS